MKFPLAEINVNDYNDEIFKLIQDDECTIFIDTNIIALMYGIHDSARKEFFDWIKTYIIKDRVKVPNWVINEYSNRFIRDQIQDYLSPLTKIKTIKKEFTHASAFLKMYIDDASLTKSKYSNTTEFQEDLKIIEEKIAKIEFTTSSKGHDYKIKVHKEIEQTFEKCIIDTDLERILSKVNELGVIRYNHKLPPGFQDDKKDLNSHGDLILWHEILEYCATKNIKKALLITNDEKKDWVYAPFKITINGRTLGNSNPQFKIVDSRLVHEFKTHTSSEEFHIVNFEQFTKILIGKISNTFIDLANALQIVHNQKSEIVEDKEDILKMEEDITANIDETTKVVESTHTVSTGNSTTSAYSSYALSDIDFPLFDDTILTKTIEELKSYNWYRQNPALQYFLEIAKNGIEENITNNDKLFVIGRNIYQSACGGSGEAMNFISELRSNFAKLNNYVINHLYSGIVYEIYFDSSNTFREENLKSHLINEVFAVSDVERLNPSKEFIKASLEHYKNGLLYFPFQTGQVVIKPIFNESTKITNDNWFGVKEFLVLNELKGNDIELLTTESENSLNVYFPNLNLLGLKNTVGKIYAIPENKIEFVVAENVDHKMPITLETKSFRKLSSLDF
jgi:hypothetical protein